MGRAPCCDKANVKKGPWSPEEDFKLKSFIETYGTASNWIALPQKIGLKRCGKSCRLRWLNYLRPNIKHGGFTEEEDNIICSLYISIGSRWSIIAAQLPERTDNDIKNYWNTKLKKKLLGRHRKQSSSSQISIGDDTAFDLSSSALERLELHMQLHSLQNSFSFNQNPGAPPLWPKLSHLQQKMIETLNSLNQNNPNFLTQQFTTTPPPPLEKDSLEPHIPFRFDGEQNMGFVNDVETVEDHEFDCFKEMCGAGGAMEDNLEWWCNAVEGESTAVIHRSEEVYGDYGVGFSM